MASSVAPSDKFYTALGMASVTFALIELGIDYAVTIVRAAGEEAAEPLPASLDAKLVFLGRAYEAMSEDAPQRADGLALLDRIVGLRELRDDLVRETALNQLDPPSAAVIRLARPGRGGVYSNEDLADLLQDSMALAQETLAHARALGEAWAGVGE